MSIGEPHSSDHPRKRAQIHADDPYREVPRTDVRNCKSFDLGADIDLMCTIAIASKPHFISAERGEAAQPPKANLCNKFFC
jgi:hypothetical protein